MGRSIEKLMHDDGVSPFFSLGTLFWVFSKIYGFIVNLRLKLYSSGLVKSKHLPCFVISVGNITAGGTGKTPMTLYLGKTLKSMGYKIAVVSRGYRGSAEKSGGIVCDGKKILMTAKEAGDEPHLIAGSLMCPVVVGSDRFKAGMTVCELFSPDVVILDDGFQHIRLHRDLNLALLDYKKPFGNSHLLPRGFLREPVKALARAHGVIFTRSGSSCKQPGVNFPGDATCFMSDHKPYVVEVNEKQGHKAGTFVPEGRKAFCFSGIADNLDFFEKIRSFGCTVTGAAEFGDHHNYQSADLEKIILSALESGADFIATTEKDYVKIKGKVDWEIPLVVFGVKIDFANDENNFTDFLKKRLWD